MSLPPLVGLIGYKRSGKNAVAETLEGEYGYLALAFADPLREMALAIDPLVGRFPLPGHLTPPEDGWRLSEVLAAIGYEKAKEIPEVRRFYQRLGTDGVRAQDPSFWLDRGTERIDTARDASRARAQGRFDAVASPVVVTDARFPNEADAIRRRGGVIVRVVRPGYEPGPDAHESETALDDYEEDYRIDNDGTLDELADHARGIAHAARVWAVAGIVSHRPFSA